MTPHSTQEEGVGGRHIFANSQRNVLSKSDFRREALEKDWRSSIFSSVDQDSSALV